MDRFPAEFEDLLNRRGRRLLGDPPRFEALNTTPLVARRGREDRARHWLLLGSFDYDPPLKKLAY